jgi:phosphoglycolate phosphatase-like HAD superfamily hydrolase
VLFDIDGVLVDIRRSYNEAIKKTVDFVLAQAGLNALRGIVTNHLILQFRQTGGFNNDTDTSYAIALAVLASSREKKGTAAATTTTMTQAHKLLQDVIKNADETGIESVEKFLLKNGKDAVSSVKEMLAYPAPVKDSYIGRVFDELFYGPELFKKQNGLEPKYCYSWSDGDKKKGGVRGGAKPLIGNDRLVVSKKTMRTLNERFGGNLAIVSGRSRVAAEYSLKPVMQYFDIDACVFLEDEKREYAKPNPYAAKKAMKMMGAKSALYCGDSAEDMLMAQKAEEETGLPIAFVGIYGFSSEPAKTLAIFKQRGAKATAKSVDSLPKMLSRLAVSPSSSSPLSPSFSKERAKD